MYNIPDEMKLLYKSVTGDVPNESIRKKLHIYFPEIPLTIENEKIKRDSFSLNESLCSNTDITLGSCESSYIEFTVVGIPYDLTGKVFTVIETIGEYSMPFGTFKVLSCTEQSDRNFKDILAFDSMKNTDIDVSAWYNSLTWPQTVKSMRESLLTYLGVEFEIQTVTNDTEQVPKTINPTSLIGRDVLRRITEINAGFGHFTRDGKFKVIQLSGLGLYPSETLYPAEDLYPSESGEYITAGYESADYEEYIVEPISSVTVREDDEDTGATAGTPGNNYIISGNYLLYGKSATELQTIVDNIFLQVKNKYYRPHSTTMIGLPYMEVGDSVTIITSNDAIESFIFKRTLTGIQALKDNISASGNQVRDQKVTPTTEIQQLKSKTLKIQKSVDQLTIDMTDMEAGLQSQITLTAGQLQTQITDNKNSLQSKITQTAGQLQTQITDNKDNADSQFVQQANAIGLKVSKDGVISAINLSSETAKIESPNIQLEGIVTANSYFKVLLDGSIEAVNGKFTGAITSNSAIITGGSFLVNASGQNDTRVSLTYAQYNTSLSPYGMQISYSSSTTGNTDVSPGMIWLGDPTTIPNYTEIKYNGISTPSLTVNGYNVITEGNKSSQINILYASSVPQVVSAGVNFRPHSSSGDNYISCGSPSYRWTQVYAATATISTSDKTLKDDIQELSEKEKIVATKIKSLFRTFKFKDAINQKGSNARLHTGVIAQDIKAVFESEGLNPYDYALFCSDTWYEVNGIACNSEEKPYSINDEGAIEVTRLGIRYEELLCFVIGAM